MEWDKNIESDEMKKVEHEDETILVDRMFHIPRKLNTKDTAT